MPSAQTTKSHPLGWARGPSEPLPRPLSAQDRLASPQATKPTCPSGFVVSYASVCGPRCHLRVQQGTRVSTLCFRTEQSWPRSRARAASAPPPFPGPGHALAALRLPAPPAHGQVCACASCGVWKSGSDALRPQSFPRSDSPRPQGRALPSCSLGPFSFLPSAPRGSGAQVCAHAVGLLATSCLSGTTVSEVVLNSSRFHCSRQLHRNTVHACVRTVSPAAWPNSTSRSSGCFLKVLWASLPSQSCHWQVKTV